MDSQRPLAVVGIGASAGGLEAFEGFFRNLAADTGLAFVLVTHLARGQHSSLKEIVSRYTSIPVHEAGNGELILPNHVYVGPPDYILTVEGDSIQLHPRSSDLQRRPIDVFLSSLAEEYGENAVGILLSGGGTDGTLGIKAIKGRGGLTIAQGSNGSGPIQSGMPDNAIAAGVIDFVLPVEKMAGCLADHVQALTAPLSGAAASETLNDHQEEELRRKICQILLKQVGHDFSGYKEKTFMRRVRRRMQVLQLSSLSRYAERLQDEPEEVKLLFRDLLIGVTNFFRDPGAFETLNTLVIPRLFENKGANDSVRVWIPGCATGEEVYSVAILLREHMDTLRASPKVQIFATDIDESALAVARMGRYPAPLMKNISPQRLQRFFVSDDVTYSASKEIRELCMFSVHSVVRDPPFSRIDLISCRNLLIYFGVDFQAQAIPVFHFALRPRGFLFLGTSENVSQYGDLFSAMDKKHRIFQRRDHVMAPLRLPQMALHARVGALSERGREPGAMVAAIRRAVENRVLERYAPAHVVVNSAGDILHYSTRTGKYLEPAPGVPNRQLLVMARKGLKLELRAVLREAAENRRPATRSNITLEIDGRIQLVDIAVEPFGENDSDPLFLVLFCDVGLPFDPADTHRNASDASEDSAIMQLEHDLREARERLQSTIEEYETAMEELKSSNEELQSMNEEMQSTNEELETSKEELQSVNEELQTVNSELNLKIEEVDRANSDLRNIFESTQIATIILDEHLVVRSFTPTVTSIFNLIASDRGRPLTDIVSHLESNADLRRDIQTVLERGESMERRVRRVGGAQYLMRILPYRERSNRIAGALITFVDLTNIAELQRS
jgi:two-component system CheB/CheR fusion protein